MTTIEFGTTKIRSDLRMTADGQIGTETWVTVSKVRQILRCTVCKAKGRRTLVQRSESTTYCTGYMPPSTRTVTRFVIGGQIVAYPVARCAECGSTDVKVNVVQGRLNRNKPCDGRCMGATGPNCECSCQGENHGGRYSEWG